jgi:3-hydroxybutyrate dehydrogenase
LIKGNSFQARLNDHTAVVTGASRGIGRALALAFANAGAGVALLARNQDALAALAEEIGDSGGKCVAIRCDVCREDEIKTAFEQLTKRLGQPDIIINNAGIYAAYPLKEQETTSWNEILQTNLTGAMMVTRTALAAMIEHGWGRIINISSISGKTGESFGSAYSASKFGMIGMTQSLALEVAKNGITVNAICPGWVGTEMAQSQLEDPKWCNLNSIDPLQSQAIARMSIPQERLIEPEEVADLALFLATDAARGITGQSINICGGLSLH